jgi:hypothetical protein
VFAAVAEYAFTLMTPLIRLEDIEEFEQARRIPRTAISQDVLKGVRLLHEIEEIEPFLRDILPDRTDTPHTSTEIADIFTPHITIAGQPRLAAFINKGKTTKSVTSKKIAHQITRVRRIPQLGIMILLAVGDIHDDARVDLLQAAQDANVDYSIIDTVDVARLFIAYQKICPQDGNPYIDGQCRLCKTSLSEPIDLTIKVHEEPWYTILEQSDVSHSGAKRYRANVLTDSHYPKLILREVVRSVVWDLCQSSYYRSELVEQRFGTQQADCVFVFLFTDLRDIPTYNWRCSATWVRPTLPIQARPITTGDEGFGEIRIQWNAEHAARREMYAQLSVKKEVWIKRIESVLPKLDRLLQIADGYTDQFNHEQIDQGTLQGIFGQMETEARDILLHDVGERGLPPVGCHECDAVFLRMASNLHDMFVPFATWGRATWDWNQKMSLMHMARQRYETDRAAFLHEWKKVR